MIASRRHNPAARRRSPRREKRSAAPRGFTLVEMLVSTALVLLMMVLFAQVFKQATDSMTRMKGMAENDQKARQLTILLRGDLQNRTFKDLKPFRYQPNVPEIADRKGYFSISENDPASGIDDVVQFTIQIPSSELPLSGRSVLLKDPADIVNSNTIDLGATTMTTEAYSFDEYLTLTATNRNQPEFDDGQLANNKTGSSISAEVSYYVRNGNLYRRMLLIRKPYDGAGQPGPLSGDYGSNKTANGSGYFWRDFDYSAFHRPSPAGVYFHTPDSLSNESVSATATLSTTPPISYPISLGIPHLRFGSTLLAGGSTHDGTPREFLNPADASTFIGRFNQQETAHSAFGYPGWIPGGGDPHDPNTALTMDADTGLVTEYQGEVYRRGEDIMLSNVHEFDVKVWDDHPSVRDWVDLGHNKQDSMGNNIGHYRSTERLNAAFGNRYDTWHPGLGSVANPFPPYLPADRGADGAWGALNTDDDDPSGTTIDDNLERGWYGSDDNVFPLRAIQITIRYYDISSNQMRQLTLVQSLLK